MILNGKMTDFDIDSFYLKRQLTVIAYRPPGYDPHKSYPLLIAQDGRDYIQIGRLTSLADHWISREIIRPLIIIAVPYQSAAQRWQIYPAEGTQHTAYLQMLCAELLPLVSERLAVSPDPAQRTLVGDSLAATFSLLAAVSRPDLFGGAILQSPFVSRPLLNRLTANSDRLPLTVYHSIGRNEITVRTTRGTVEDFYEPNLKLHRVLAARLARYEYHETDGRHTWRAWQPDIRRALLDRYDVLRSASLS
ncbi:MAG: alpha/beta hydrolase-fold protein [Sporolactobacillus sp.]|nr:alpha/beta hydrolase-fold protein [Sporolactobacillus sp.]